MVFHIMSLRVRGPNSLRIRPFMPTMSSTRPTQASHSYTLASFFSKSVYTCLATLRLSVPHSTRPSSNCQSLDWERVPGLG